MKVLVPIDGSDCSFRALEFGIELVNRYEGSLHVVHLTEVEGESSREIIDRAKDLLADHGIDEEPEVVTDLQMSEPRYANRVGKDIVQMAEEGDYDHVVMGHHGTGTVGRIILGSAAETVLRAADVPVTIVP